MLCPSMTWWSYLTCRRQTAPAQKDEEVDVESGSADPREVEITPVLRIRIPRTVSCERCDLVKVIGAKGESPTWVCEPCETGLRSRQCCPYDIRVLIPGRLDDMCPVGLEGRRN